MRLTDEEIEQRTELLRGRSNKLLGENEKRKTRNAVKGMRKILEASGHDEPEESDYEEYRRQSYAKDKSNGYQTTYQNISRIERFFAPQEEGSEQLSMIPEEEMTEGMKDPEALGAVEEAEYGADDETSTENVQASEEPEAEMTAPNESESLPEPDPVQVVRKPTKNKGGRKPLDTENGEIRSEKMTAYFTPSMAENIRLWCDWTGISFGDLTVKLFGAFLRDKGDMLNGFRKSREEAKRMNDA